MRGRICESAEDSLGSSLLERHISRLSNHRSTACEPVVKEVRGSAAWSSFIQKSTTGNSQAAPDYLGKISNSLSNSPGAYDKLVREHTAALLKLLLSFFVLDYSKVGLNAHVGRSTHGHRVVKVGAKKFELGKQIVYPPKDSLICRGTATFMAREMSEDELVSDCVNIDAWDLCYKINSGRPQEGAFFFKLQGVRNVVECQGYDTGSATLQGRDQCVFGNYGIQKLGKPSLDNKPSSNISQPAPRPAQGPGQSPTGSKRVIPSRIPSSSSLGQTPPRMVKTEKPPGSGIHQGDFSNRDCRQLVMTYIPWEFDDLFDPLPGKEGNYIDQYRLPPTSEPECAILRCWARFFETVRDLIRSPCRIMHRDISFTNIRIKRVDGGTHPRIF